MTFSLLARDPQTGQTCYAVASLFTAVGAMVPQTRDGVGTVMTQSYGDPWLAQLILDQLGQGLTPPAALEAGLAAYPSDPEVRQLAVMDGQGRLAQWTGRTCFAWAGHLEADGVAVQGNLLANDRVLPAMVEAWQSAPPSQSLGQRLLTVLVAGQREGGDRRGQEGAAIGVRPFRVAQSDQLPLDLRIDSHVRPLEHLERLLTRWEAQDRRILR